MRKLNANIPIMNKYYLTMLCYYFNRPNSFFLSNFLFAVSWISLFIWILGPNSQRLLSDEYLIKAYPLWSNTPICVVNISILNLWCHGGGLFCKMWVNLDCAQKEVDNICNQNSYANIFCMNNPYQCNMEGNICHPQSFK